MVQNQCTTSNPCKNSGSCQSIPGGGFVCLCRSGFAGNLCERVDGTFLSRQRWDASPFSPLSFAVSSKNNCAVNPCENGGTCVPIEPNTFQCICPPGFTGGLCEARDGNNPSFHSWHMQNDWFFLGTGTTCATNPCKNGGACSIVPGGGFQCTCRAGFIGLLCDAATGIARIACDERKRSTCSDRRYNESRFECLRKKSVFEWWILCGDPRWRFHLYVSFRFHRRLLWYRCW